jgi:cysteine desulfurase
LAILILVAMPMGGGLRRPLRQARAQVAKIINADPREVIFTSGATESNNLAIKGVAHFYKEKKDHIVTCADRTQVCPR